MSEKHTTTTLAVKALNRHEAVRETLISDCLDRLAQCVELTGDEFEGYDTSFAREKARAALDRLFVDLKDFAGEK